MSCDSLAQQQSRFNVTAGALPEGFCPANLQEFFEAIVARMIIGTNQQFSSFVIGPNEPTSNQGPWLKDCLQWFVWDDATSHYVPMQTFGGFNNEQLFIASGTFVVPAFITKLRVSVWGGGGGGAVSGASPPGAGGGGGAFVKGLVTVVPAQVIAVTVGLGGAQANPGGTGGTSTFLTMSAGGGTGGAVTGATTPNGPGGTAAGGTLNMDGQAGDDATTGNPGAGGDSPQGGGGGRKDFALNRPALHAGVFPGGGGAGGSTGASDAGPGANGAILVEW